MQIVVLVYVALRGFSFHGSTPALITEETVLPLQERLMSAKQELVAIRESFEGFLEPVILRQVPTFPDLSLHERASGSVPVFHFSNDWLDPARVG